MSLHSKARTLVNKVAVAVAKGRRKVAERLARSFGQGPKRSRATLRGIRSRSRKLRKALAYHYLPTHDETVGWMEHCYQIESAGSASPDEKQWWAFVALSRWEFQHDS